MSVNFRSVVIVGGTAALLAGVLASPALFAAAFANEPQSNLVKTAKDLFQPPFDLRKLKKFDVSVDHTVSTDVQRTQYVRKIGYGQKTLVAIVTTPSGTYSSDALTSPYVRYPGIDVTPKYRRDGFWASMSSSRYGIWTSSSYSAGSFTYYNYSFTPKR